MNARTRSTSMTVAVAAMLVPVVAWSAPTAASPQPYTPHTLEASVEACAKAKSGDRCTMQVEQQETHGVCVVFTRSELVCAADAPQ